MWIHKQIKLIGGGTCSSLTCIELIEVGVSSDAYSPGGWNYMSTMCEFFRMQASGSQKRHVDVQIVVVGDKYMHPGLAQYPAGRVGEYSLEHNLTQLHCSLIPSPALRKSSNKLLAVLTSSCDLD